MKNHSLRLALGFVFASSPLLVAQDITLSLDFGSASSPVVSGYTAVTANFLSNTPVASVSDIDGLGYGFSINNVGVFSFDSADNPLTTDGFYTFGNETLDHSFTLSGLNPGDQVSLYALAAWDGNGRGAQVSFGGGTVQAQTINTPEAPGTTPALGHFTFIGSDTVTATGMLTGAIHGAGFPGVAASEGQVGGFIFVITPAAIPEPSAAALMLGFAAVGCVAIRRRARRA